MPATQRWTAAMVAQHNTRMARDQGKAPARPLAQAADIFPALRRLAEKEGWRGQHTYNALGPDDGLHVILVRDTIIFAYVLDEGAVLTPSQRRWKEAIEQSGQGEVYVWWPASWREIEARLTRPHVRQEKSA